MDDNGAHFGDMPADVAYRWKQVGTLDHVPAYLYVDIPNDRPGHYDTYGQPGAQGPGPTLEIATYQQPDGDDMVVRTYLRTVTVIWHETPSVIAVVHTEGLTRLQALQVVESLRRA